jgi:hypothetical protein
MHQPPLETSKEDLEGCAQRCGLFPACKSFDFERPLCANADVTFGVCQLFVDGERTALPNVLRASGGSTRAHYSKVAYTAQTDTFALADGVFFGGQLLSPDEGGQPAGTTTALVSVEQCAYACGAAAGCLSFAAGVGARLGECALYRNAGRHPANLTTGAVASLEELRYYIKSDPDGRCREGFHSTTGRGPGCTVCAKGSYTDVEQRQCLPCPARFTTHGAGTATIAGCVAPVCPAHAQATAPDEDSDCTCKVGSRCVGGDAQCRVAPANGVHFFAVSCAECACTEPIAPPTIDFVWTPHAGSIHYTGDVLVTSYQASNGVKRVHVGLFRMDDVLPNHVVAVRWMCISSKNTGVCRYRLADSLETRDDYIVVVLHAAGQDEERAPTHRNTFPFSIHPPRMPCLPGYANPATGGLSPGCVECAIGTYWHNASECASCPANSTTAVPGVTSAAGCNVASHHALYQFLSVPRHFLGGASDGGYYMEDVGAGCPHSHRLAPLTFGAICDCTSLTCPRFGWLGEGVFSVGGLCFGGIVWGAWICVGGLRLFPTGFTHGCTRGRTRVLPGGPNTIGEFIVPVVGRGGRLAENHPCKALKKRQLVEGKRTHARRDTSAVTPRP